PELRSRFSGKPEYVMNFMLFIAEELREIMAKLGVRTVDELVGHTEKLRMREKRVTHRADTIDLSAILGQPSAIHFKNSDKFDFELEKTLDESVLIPAFEPFFAKKKSHSENVTVSSTNRTFGTILGSVITKKFGNSLDDDTYTVNCCGGGGQSFGAFIPKGLTIDLTGDANDYFGKGLSGGKLVVKPEKGSAFDAKDNIIIGNVALYGATDGEAFINGIAGERFCVRNSGAVAVCEGCGDHGCEYMTGGRAVILGKTGKNFAAGMSGGIAYVFDDSHDLYMKINKEMVHMSEVTEKRDVTELKALISEHVRRTGSPFGKTIMDDFDGYLPKFKKIIPKDYERMLNAVEELEEKGVSREEATMQAFYALQRS
ncbi:MAG: glutamate synthase subunit alpha, partial [Eubacteriales bacterium]|nr:glutamate synthase subunit alpha [Eubacteriales bacterium]